MIEPMIRFLEFYEEGSVDPKYTDFLDNVRVMTGASIVEILNTCCFFMDDDKCYLEIGTHRGSTLLGAAFENVGKKFKGVDNFCGHNSKIECEPFETVEEGLQYAISKVGHEGVTYEKEDYISFLAGKNDVDGRKVEVYLYDGDHSEHATFTGVSMALPLLADEAIIFLDDTAFNDGAAIHSAVERLMELFPNQLSLVKEWKPDFNSCGFDRELGSYWLGRGPGSHGDMWCGFMALRFEKYGTGAGLEIRLDDADAQALEHALTITEHERDAALERLVLAERIIAADRSNGIIACACWADHICDSCARFAEWDRGET